MKRTRFGSCAVVLSGAGAIAASSMVACGPGAGASSHFAKEPEYARESKCAVTKSQAEPLIVEWPSSSRAKIEALSKTGVVAVRYNGCEMEVLASCNAPGKYGYTAITAKRDRVVIKSADDLYANIPLGAARLEGKLQSSGELDVSMAVVGRYSTDKRVIRADELDGADCAKATHFVSALTVGAFEFFAGADATIGGGVNAGVAGAGGKSETKRELLNADGKMATCDAATTADTKPPDGCGAIVRLEVVPLGQAKKEEPVCPVGMQWNGTQCSKGDANVSRGGGAGGGGEELRFEVGEKEQKYTVTVESNGVMHACPAPVTYHTPCKLYDVPDGPATVHARGDVNYDRDIKVDESGRAEISSWNRGHGTEIGLGIAGVISGGMVIYGLTANDGLSGTNAATGHSLNVFNLILVTIGAAIGVPVLIALPFAIFTDHDMMAVKRGNNAQLVSKPAVRFIGPTFTPAATSPTSGGTLGATFVF